MYLKKTIVLWTLNIIFNMPSKEITEFLKHQA